MKCLKKRGKRLSEPTRPVWACPKRCDLSKGTCEHLEKLLPSVEAGKTKGDRSLSIVYTDRIEDFSASLLEEEPQLRLPFVEAVLRSAPEITTAHMAVVLGRVSAGLSYAELSKRLNLNVRTVHNLYQEAISILQNQFLGSNR